MCYGANEVTLKSDRLSSPPPFEMVELLIFGQSRDD
jgi:hypothetical protein